MECGRCKSTNIEEDEARAEMICQDCGQICEVNDIQGVTEFHEMDNGRVVAVGKSIESLESKQITIKRANDKISSLCSKLFLTRDLVAYATNIYKNILSQGKTRGIKSSVMIGACVYLSARANKQSLMLLDISDKINESVYVIGKVYNEIKSACNLRVADIDPCIFIERFANDLGFGDKKELVCTTALKLLQRMKKDWISTGRRPSGITAAALLIAARIHHFDRNYEDVARIAGISKNTAKKRLQEWSKTSTANLTLSDFKKIDFEKESDPPSYTESILRQSKRDLQISDEDFSKIKEQIYRMGLQLDEIEGPDDRLMLQLMNSVEHGMINMTDLIGDMDDNESDMGDELAGRRNLINECIQKSMLGEMFGKISKQEDPDEELTTELVQTNEQSLELPITMSLSDPVFDCSNMNFDLDDDELRSQYVVTDQKEVLRKLKWFFKENNDYFRNKKLSDQRKEEKRIKSEKSGVKRLKRRKRDNSYLDEAKIMIDGMINSNIELAAPTKILKLSPFSEENSNNSSLKSEMQANVHEDEDNESVMEPSDNVSEISFEVTHNFDED